MPEQKLQRNMEPRLNNVVGVYLTYGGDQPPLERLVQFSDILKDNRDPLRRLVSAEIDLQIAVLDPSQAEERLDSAEKQLERVKKKGDVQLKYRKKDLRQIATPAVAARLRRAEIHNWQKVTVVETPDHGYAELLEAANETYGYLRLIDTTTEAKLIEFMPVLLGARAVEHGLPVSWLGRMAFMREDLCQMSKSDYEEQKTASWDAGVSTAIGPNEFHHPSVRFDVKKSRTRPGERKRAEQAGVKLLIAKRCGFDDSAAIIKGCLLEANIKPIRSPGFEVAPLAPEQLDSVTGNIARELKLPIAA